MGSMVSVGVLYESNEVERTPGRFLETVFDADDDLFDKQDFYGAEAAYHFMNSDNEAFPTLGMLISVTGGYKNNVSTSKGFAYLIPELGFDYKLIPSGNIVLATKSRAHINFGNDFEFYQAAALGANTGLRGYRHQRFTGKRSFVQTTDVRFNLRRLKTGILPLNIGIYGGADVGRVWLPGDDSDRWNSSVGGGVFADAAEMLTFNLSAFNSDDGIRIAFRLGFGF